MTQTPPRPDLPPALDPRRAARPERPSPGSNRLRRALVRTAVAVSVLVLVVSVGGYAAFTYYNARIGRINIQLPGHPVPPGPPAGAAQTFLLVGSDTRNFPGGNQFQATPGSTDYVTGQRSDTAILVYVPPGTAKVTAISFPRDSWVTIPAYTGRNGVHVPAHQSKINSAFALGGAPLLIATIENISGLRVDHYVQVDFAGFEHMVNALGGVSICVNTTRHDKDSGDYLTRGTHFVNGAQALAFVRDRKGLPRGDIDRILDQQYFLSVMLHSVLSAGTLANPFKLNAFLKAATASVTVDDGLSFADLRTLALRMRHLDPAHLTFTTLPFTSEAAWRDGQLVVLPDQDKIHRMFAALTGQSPAPSPTPHSATPALTVPAAAVSVTVLNGGGVAGLAARAAADLRSAGFVVTGIANAATSGATQSVIRYPANQAAAARTLAAAVPGAVLQPDGSSGGIVLVVGGGYAGAHPVGVEAPGAGGGSTPSGPANLAPRSTTAAANAQGCAP